MQFCEFCCIAFNDKRAYNKHIKTKKHKRCLELGGYHEKYECPKCKQTFTTKQNLNRHSEQCCLDKYISNDVCLICKKHISKINNLTKHINYHKKAIGDENIDVILAKTKSCIINNNNNTINNNFNIVIYGNEDFSYIDQKALEDALQTRDVLPKLCKMMRNNPNRPENRNVKVTDFSRGKVKIYTEHGWEIAHPVDTFNNMIIEASDIIDTQTMSGTGPYEQYYDKVDTLTDNVHNMDIAKDKGTDTFWAKDNRRNIMLQFVN